ncbi:MAG: GNAT family N-acetyltransferase [Phycisphaerae bacterium]
MPAHTATIERLAPPVCDADLGALAGLLVDAVDSGAAVSFLAPLTLAHAEDWWRRTIASAHPKAAFLVAREAASDGRPGGIVGTAQLHPAWAPNQPHRAEVAKVIVHRRFRGAGLGRRLMEAIEEHALAAGLSLLTLDAKRGGAAERLYRKMGWNFVGTIPRYALDTDGQTPHDTVIFYKALR